MVIGKKVQSLINVPSLHLSADSSKCTSCSICDKNCQMSLDVKEMVKKGSLNHPECILCGQCVDYCPRGAISFTVVKKSRGQSGGRSKHVPDVLTDIGKSQTDAGENSFISPLSISSALSMTYQGARGSGLT